MPSILDYLDHPEFLQSVIGGDTAGSFGQPQQPQQPPPPPPNIMAQAPPQFGPGGAVDGGTGPAASFSDRFSPGPEPISMPTPTTPPMPRPRPVPMPQPRPPNFGPSFADRAAPAQAAIASGDFDPQGRNYTDFGLSPDAGSAMAFAEAPRTRNGFPYEAPQGGGEDEAVPLPRPNPMRDDEISVNRTPRNGMSLDDMAVDNGARPVDIRSPVQRGEPDPRIQRARAFGNFMASLGHGLTAVGNQKPGTSGAAAFAGGAGGALTGGVENERHNLDRDERGLDRAERGRERDQTFDYQNRTLRANTDYHDKLIEQHRLDRGDRTEQHIADREARTNAERYTPVGQDADGRIIYSDRNHPGREITGDNKSVSRIGAASQGGNTERLARIIQAEHGKDADGNYKITMEDAVRRAQSHPTDAADISRRERMARQDLKDHENSFRRGDTRKTLEDFRRALGLAPAPPPPPTPPRPNEAYRSAPMPAAPGQITPFVTPSNPTPTPSGAPSVPVAGPTPPLPATGAGLAPVRPAMPMPGSNGQPAPYPANPALSRPPLPGPTPTPAPPFNPGPLPPSPTVGGPAPTAAAPPRPPQVPPGSQYSPSRNQWRAPDGRIIPGEPPQ